MIANLGTLKAFQNGCYADLAAEHFFDPVGKIVADNGDMATLIEQAEAALTDTGNKQGAWLVIGMVTGKVEKREVQKENTVTAGDPPVTTTKIYKPYIQAELWIACSESFVENRDPDTGAGIPALTLAEAVMQALHRPVSEAHLLPRYVDGPYPIAAEDKPDKMPDTTKVGYLVKVTTEGWATALNATPITLEP